MKITSKNSSKYNLFCHLRVGTVFKDASSGNLYMKISIVDDANGKVLANAVKLDNGYAGKFNDDAEIVKVDAELIVEQKGNDI